MPRSAASRIPADCSPALRLDRPRPVRPTSDRSKLFGSHGQRPWVRYYSIRSETGIPSAHRTRTKKIEPLSPVFKGMNHRPVRFPVLYEPVSAMKSPSRLIDHIPSRCPLSYLPHSPSAGVFLDPTIVPLAVLVSAPPGSFQRVGLNPVPLPSTILHRSFHFPSVGAPNDPQRYWLAEPLPDDHPI